KIRRVYVWLVLIKSVDILDSMTWLVWAKFVERWCRLIYNCGFVEEFRLCDWVSRIKTEDSRRSIVYVGWCPFVVDILDSMTCIAGGRAGICGRLVSGSFWVAS
ncbi:hypothetical protein AVEN_12255-1, partial [Araneus ventricosus]